jgi:uncharacterized membrane protein YhhN
MRMIVGAVLKALPALGLAIWICTRDPSIRAGPGMRLAAGLACGALGDFLLAAPGLFLAGMAAFFAQHALYVSVFFPEREMRAARLPWAAGLAIAACGLFAVLSPHLGALTWPVLIYSFALLAMAVTAVLRRPASLTVALGATLFFASDALLAVNRFVTRLPAAGVTVLATYYAGQLLIARGWVHDRASTQ